MSLRQAKRQSNPGRDCASSLRARQIELHPAPNLARHLDAQPQLRPLLLLGQHIAFLGAGEAALRRQRKLLQREYFAA